MPGHRRPPKTPRAPVYPKAISRHSTYAPAVPKAPKAPKPPAAKPVVPKAQTAAKPTAATGYGNQQDLASANALALALLGPQRTQANADYQAQLDRGLSGIRNLTQGIIGMVSPFEGRVAGLYKGAEQSQATIDAALRGATSRTGQEQASQLAGKLNAIGAPANAVSELAGAQSSQGEGAANAAFGIGTAELSRLLGAETADRAYILKQPGILGGLGVQAAGQFATGQADALSQRLQQIESQAPGIVMHQLDQLEAGRAREATAQATSAYRQEQLNISQQRANTSVAVAKDNSAYKWASLESRQKLAILAQKDKNARAALTRADKLNNQERTQANANRNYELAYKRYLKSGGKTAPEVKGSPVAEHAVSLAKQYIGTKYVYGGAAPGGFDCSGLVQYVWGKVGVKVPRTAAQQFHSGLAVSPDALQPGDALFFVGAKGTPDQPGHEAMYVGNGMVIVAPHTGGVVQVVPLSSIPGFVGARRYAAGTSGTGVTKPKTKGKTKGSSSGLPIGVNETKK